MYLRGVATGEFSARSANGIGGFRANDALELFPAAVQRVWWHALRGDSIVLVSGTLAPLAEIVKYALERELLWRGVETKISVLATQLEICAGRCTGRVDGAAMFGEEKARAAREFALRRNISLAQCSAYGDSSLDRWMLASVGHPFAVNSTSRLRRIARLRGWQMPEWTHCPVRTAGEQRALKFKDEAAR
jgi:phosphoserine phosphatase